MSLEKLLLSFIVLCLHTEDRQISGGEVGAGRNELFWAVRLSRFWTVGQIIWHIWVSAAKTQEKTWDLMLNKL